MFTINLATRVYIDKRLLRFCTGAAAILLAGFLVLVVQNVMRNSAEMKDLEKQITVMDEKIRTANRGFSEKNYNTLVERINFANSVIEKKTYNWLSLLDRLEKVVPDGVAISSIQPEPKSQSLKLSGITRSFKNLRIFMEHLEDSKLFSDMYLVSQTETKLGDGSQGIAFNLICKVTTK